MKVFSQNTSHKKSPKAVWSIEEHHPCLVKKGGPCYNLFYALRDRITVEFPSWKENINKHYIGYKIGKKLVLSAEERKSGKLMLNIRISIKEINDPNHICEDKRNAGRISPNMKTIIVHEDVSDLDNVIKILKQV